MRKKSFLNTAGFVGAVCVIGILTSCNASWDRLDIIAQLFGVELKQASGCGCDCLGMKGTIRITNDLNVNIAGVFISSVDDTEWGDNYLTEVLPSGSYYETSVDEGLWDIATVDSDSNVRYRLEVLVTAGETINLNVSELTLHTDDDPEDFVFDDVLPNGSPTTVPNVVGMTQSAAENAIKNAGFVVGSVTKHYSSAVAVGNVMTQMPLAGNVVPGGSMVSIAVAVAEDLSFPALEAELLAEDVRWQDLPDLAQETAAIAVTLNTFTDALKEGDVDAAVLEIYSTKRAAYKELFDSRPEAMESFADLLDGVTISFLGGEDAYIGKQAGEIPPERTAEYKVILDGHTFYVGFVKEDGSWVLYDF